MSADLLRRAAALMRERAEAVDQEHFSRRVVAKVGRLTPQGQHIATMHPAVALAVADWLDATADYLDASGTNHKPIGPDSAALTVARRYLGESA